MTQNPDVKIAYEEIIAKRRDYNLLWRYYEGDQPLVYSVEKLREVFTRAGVTFNENWCAVVVDSTMERLQLANLSVMNNDDASLALGGLMSDTELNLEDDSIHLAALVCGEAFLIAWLSDDGQPEAYYNDPRLCHVEYSADNPHKKLWAAKMWQDGKIHFLTLYYPDRIEYYTAEGEMLTSSKAFVLREEENGANPAENPYGVIPVFHFRRVRRTVSSELLDITPVQDAINKLIADMMVAAEYSAFRQRWIISNEDTDTLKNSPNEIWQLPAGDGVGQQTQVGQFDATELKNYIEAIASKVNAVAAISRTPHYYFFSQGDMPSGEALIALEAPLNKKAARLTGILGRTWQAVAQFLLMLQGTTVELNDIRATWEPIQTVQPRTEAEIREINVRSGIPLETVLRMQGWTKEQIEQMREDRIQEQADQQNSLAKALLAQERQFDQGGV